MKAKSLTRIGLIGCVALTLSFSGVNARAHGGGCCFWPFIPFAFGMGAALAAAATAHSYSYPAYVYSPPPYPPSYAYNAPAASAATVDHSQFVAVSQPMPWHPSTPGAGHWVPDPTPYNYAAADANRNETGNAVSVSQTVTFTHSAGNVPVYVIDRQPLESTHRFVYNQ